MKTCLFSTIFRNVPIEEAITKTSEIGYEGIEIRSISHLPEDTSTDRVRELARMIRDEGLEPVNLYINFGGYSTMSDSECGQRLDVVKRYLEMAAGLGCTLIKDGPGGPSPRNAVDEHWERSVYWMSKVADEAEQYRINIALEIHHGNLLEDTDSALKYLNLIHRENVGVLFDPGNMNIVSAPFGPDVIRKLGHHILHVHVKDSAKSGSADDPNRSEGGGLLFWNRLLGEGEVDHGPVFRALKEIGYSGFLSTECQVTGMDAAAVAEHEYRKMREILEEVTGEKR